MSTQEWDVQQCLGKTTTFLVVGDNTMKETVLNNLINQIQIKHKTDGTNMDVFITNPGSEYLSNVHQAFQLFNPPSVTWVHDVDSIVDCPPKMRHLFRCIIIVRPNPQEVKRIRRIYNHDIQDDVTVIEKGLP